MKKAREFMAEFMHTLRNVAKYHDIKLNPVEPNYDEYERTFSEEKKIVETYSQDSKRITWKDELRVDGLPILTLEEVELEMQSSKENDDFER